MIKLQIFQQTILEAKHPAMHDRKLVLRPTLLDSRRLDNIAALLHNIQLHELIVLLALGAALLDHGIELLLMQTVYVADVPQPGVEKAHVLGGHGGFDTSAAVVAADDDVLDFEVANRVVNDGHDVQVDVVD